MARAQRERMDGNQPSQGRAVGTWTAWTGIRRAIVLVVFASAASACATATTTVTAAAPPPPGRDGGGLFAAAPQYMTAARPDGVVGGARAVGLAEEVRAVLRARGDEAEADGVLAASAASIVGAGAWEWIHSPGEVALRSGFPGLVVTAGAFYLDDGGRKDVWRLALADVASNLSVTRYGVYVSPDGVAAVVLGRMEVSLDPFPRRFRPGETCRLRGEVAHRYERARVYMTRPDGTVAETAIPGRKIDLSLALAAPGAYRLEVMSDGASGPVVLANVPLYVGIDEPAWAPAPPPDNARPADPAQAEARMLALLNDVRREARLPPLVTDPELRAVALGHTDDMIARRFFGHVSPVTG